MTKQDAICTALEYWLEGASTKTENKFHVPVDEKGVTIAATPSNIPNIAVAQGAGQSLAGNESAEAEHWDSTHQRLLSEILASRNSVAIRAITHNLIAFRALALGLSNEDTERLAIAEEAILELNRSIEDGYRAAAELGLHPDPEKLDSHRESPPRDARKDTGGGGKKVRKSA